jgi:preprotein translocase subunit SecB
MAENEQAPGQQPSTPFTPETRFGVQRIYLKDVSLEAPDSPEAFRRAYSPQVSFSINSRSKKLEGSMYEVVLRLTADVKQDNKTSFLVEVQQAGIFEVAGLEGERLEQVLSITCPTVLFPYGREAIDSLVTKASFPPLMLAPINFEAVYLSAKKKQAENAVAAGGQVN